MAKKAPKNCRLARVGGSAVIEGVMMKAGDRASTACRTPDGKIVVVDKKFESARKKHKILGIPFLRGIVNFIESLTLSFSTLTLSAEMAGEDAVEKESKFEKWLKKTFGKSIFDFIMFIAGALGILLSILLFTYLPNQIAEWIEYLAKWNIGKWDGVAKAAIAGVLRMVIFVIYILVVSLMKDIRRTFEYHGAEHKSIACYEAGEELTPENAKKHSRFHPRCGTSFIFVMLFISIAISILIRIICEIWIGCDFGKFSSLAYTGIGILTIPLIVGIGFEFLMIAGKHDNFIIRLLSAPGLWMQRLTTREPDEEQLAVAITALKCAMPEEFPDFDRSQYIVRDEYNHPPVKGKKGKDAKEEEPAAPTEAPTDAPASETDPDEKA